MAIYDVFVFNNEFELLLTRLVEHGPFVDYFVLIQADRTFTGKQKALHFPNSDKRFSPFFEKIIVKNIQLKEHPSSPWENELLQRNFSFSCIKYQPEDIIYLSDVDEMISRKHWPELIAKIKQGQNPLSVWLEMFNFYINYRLVESKWLQPKLLLGQHFLNSKKTANDFRVDYTIQSTQEPCGWHFSYIMNEDQIQEKLSAFSHQEYNRPIFNQREKIRDQLRKRRDVFKRGLRFEPVSFSQDWPLQMQEDPYWRQFICSTEPLRNSLADLIGDYYFWTTEFLRSKKDEFKKWVKSSLDFSKLNIRTQSPNKRLSPS